MFSSDLEVAGTPPQPYNNDPTPYGENDTFPERQINSATENITLPLFGTRIKATGGFMEPHGHGYKSEARYFIDSRNLDQIQRRDPGNYNIGVDYVVLTPEEDAQNWYSGTVSYATTSDGGYGQSVYIDSDVQYVLNGNSYPVKLAYSHLDEIDPAMTTGARVEQGQRVGEMGGTGTTPNAYPEHVDFRAWIEVPRADGQGLRKVYISPDALSQNLLQQQYGLSQTSVEGTTRTALKDSPKTTETQWINPIASNSNSTDISSEDFIRASNSAKDIYTKHLNTIVESDFLSKSPFPPEIFVAGTLLSEYEPELVKFILAEGSSNLSQMAQEEPNFDQVLDSILVVAKNPEKYISDTRISRSQDQLAL